MVCGRDGTAGHGASGNVFEWNSGTRLSAIHQHFWFERHQAVLQLYQRLFPRPAGGSESPAKHQSPAGTPAATFAMVSDWRNLSLPTRRSELQLERDQGNSGLAGAARIEAGPR